MPNPQRLRLKRCLGKSVNHLELSIASLAEVWAASTERDKLIAARPPQEYVPILDDGREPEPSYTDGLAMCLQMMDKVNTLIQTIALDMMAMDHEELMRMVS